MIWVMKATLYFRGHGTSLDITDTPTINKIIIRPRKKKISSSPNAAPFIYLKKKNICATLQQVSISNITCFSNDFLAGVYSLSLCVYLKKSLNVWGQREELLEFGEYQTRATECGCILVHTHTLHQHSTIHVTWQQTQRKLFFENPYHSFFTFLISVKGQHQLNQLIPYQLNS